jgi:hypothetical protein
MPRTHIRRLSLPDGPSGIESPPEGLVPGSISKNAVSDDEEITFRPGAINRHSGKTHGQSENR